MNIFHTHSDPIQAAKNLDDLRVNKMIIESAALLANAIAHYGGSQHDLPISKTSGKAFRTNAWQNHPSCLWVKQSKSNYDWLFIHMVALIAEMFIRKGTRHSMTDNLKILQKGVNFLPDGPLTTFENCTPYKTISDPIEAYQLCMAYKWEHDKRQPKWTNSARPNWYSPELINRAHTTLRVL